MQLDGLQETKKLLEADGIPEKGSHSAILPILILISPVSHSPNSDRSNKCQQYTNEGDI